MRWVLFPHSAVIVNIVADTAVTEGPKFSGESLPTRPRRKPTMPYILVSTQIRMETGPTTVGDEYSDPAIMTYLGANRTVMLGNNFSEYHVKEPPRIVLDKLEKLGYNVVSMTGVGQTLVWCLHKETRELEQQPITSLHKTCVQE